MLIPSQQRADVCAHTQRYLLDVIKNPLLFLQYRPRTTICHLTPQMVPYFNDKTISNESKIKSIRDLIALLTDSNSPSFTSITSNDLAIVLDSGCTIVMTPDSSDFIDRTYKTQFHNVGGIGSGLTTSGIDHVNWNLTDIKGMPVVLTLTCLHVPTLLCQLFPPQ